jgi:hypothetical protein
VLAAGHWRRIGLAEKAMGVAADLTEASWPVFNRLFDQALELPPNALLRRYFIRRSRGIARQTDVERRPEPDCDGLPLMPLRFSRIG